MTSTSTTFTPGDGPIGCIQGLRRARPWTELNLAVVPWSAPVAWTYVEGVGIRANRLVPTRPGSADIDGASGSRSGGGFIGD